jgi:hypothetical protein
MTPRRHCVTVPQIVERATVSIVLIVYLPFTPDRVLVCPLGAESWGLSIVKPARYFLSSCDGVSDAGAERRVTLRKVGRAAQLAQLSAMRLASSAVGDMRPTLTLAPFRHP